MLGRIRRSDVSPVMLRDLETWTLIKMGFMRPTKEELESMDLDSVRRLVGFELGSKELEERHNAERARMHELQSMMKG